MGVDDIVGDESNGIVDSDSSQNEFISNYVERKPNNLIVRKAKVLKGTMADKLRAYGVSFKFGWNSSLSKLHYLNSRRIAADTISRRTGIEDVDQIEAGLELAASHILDVRVDQDFLQLKRRKKQVYDEIADFVANPGKPSLNTKKNFIYKPEIRINLNTRTDLAYIIPLSSFIASVVLFAINPITSVPFSFLTVASSLGAKPLDAYLNSALNNRQYREAIPLLQKEGEKGFRLFMEMYKKVEPRCAASQTHLYGL
jgi:hypothetical protein